MKTTVKNTCLSLFLIAALLFSAFTEATSGLTTNTPKQKSSELNKITAFTKMTICNPIQVALKKKVKTRAFSRCWSGYAPQVASTESAKTNDFAYGTIVFYNGCSPEYICNFKVCVDKGYAAVRSKESKEYMPVSEWLKEQSAKKAG